MQLAIDLLFANTAGNELGNLGTEIENEDFLVSHFQALNEQGRLSSRPGESLFDQSMW
jgi:hypothetical protein